jgi:hypothetical protein
MASAIEQLPSGLTIGHAQLGMHGAQQGTINQQVHDDDTVTTLLDGNLGIRFWAWTPGGQLHPPRPRGIPSHLQPGLGAVPDRPVRRQPAAVCAAVVA